MNFLILGGPVDHGGGPAYRGTNRSNPSYCDHAAPDDEINRLFQWYITEGDEVGVVHDLARACRFAELWNRQLAADRFEVVEVTDGANSQGTGEHLGFDISAGFGFSILGAGGLGELEPGVLPERVDALCRLMTAHFAPKLNKYVLFSTLDDAQLCLRVIVAIQSIQPNLFESGDLSEFGVADLYVVWPKG